MLCYNDTCQTLTLDLETDREGDSMLEIRSARVDDLDQIAELEQKCFPAAEAADRNTIKERLNVFPNHFWLLERDGKLVSVVDGMVSDSGHLDDRMYEDASLHQEDGKYQMIFGVETDPQFRGRGYAQILMKEVIKDCINDSRKGIILHCKDNLVPFYSKLGFHLEGESGSTHGGEKWNRMIMNLENEI